MRASMVVLWSLVSIGCGTESSEPTTQSARNEPPQHGVRVPQQPEPLKEVTESGDVVADHAPSPDSAEPRPEWEPEPYRHAALLASDREEALFLTIAKGEKTRTRIAIHPNSSIETGDCFYQLQIEDYFPETDSFFTQEALISTLPWMPLDYSPRSGTDLFVLCATVHGWTLIERWRVKPSDGTLVVERPVASTPIGTPLPALQPRAEVRYHDKSRSDSEEDQGLSLERSTIELGVEEKLQRDLVVDPDGRYLVVLDTKAFRRIDLRDNSSTTLVALGELPDAAAKIDSLFIRHHEELGRLLFARTRGSESELDFRLIFIDADNDGVFEDRQQHDHASMMKLIGNPPAFVDDY
jgi:hypothetical protein